ncbi:MAG: hypothetical protein HQK88_06100 [Nitrospirae bacterium]|nr:hypothetical protein [Nitrospirota bacterium]MBF0534583.1 hypothetical protein [Nitrospirota bacterium]MBF0616373.1 hypothetical protein [Nitrospirota bacterium]
MFGEVLMRKQQYLSAVKKMNLLFLSVTILAVFFYASMGYAGVNTPETQAQPIPDSESVTKGFKDTGKSGPSKEETIAFIQERCDNLKYMDDKIVDRVYLEGCNLVLLQTYGRFGQKDTQKVKITIPLADMDPLVIRLGFDPNRVLYTGFINSGVQLNSKDEQNKITVFKEYYDSEGKYKKEESKAINAIFHCKNETVAQKVANAAAHLIEICGGKKDLF